MSRAYVVYAVDFEPASQKTRHPARVDGYVARYGLATRCHLADFGEFGAVVA